MKYLVLIIFPLLSVGCLEKEKDYLYQKGISYYNQKDFENSIVYFDSAIVLGFNDYKAFLYLTYAYCAIDEWDKALKLAHTVNGLEHNYKRIYGLISFIHIELENYDSTLYYISKSIELGWMDSPRLYNTAGRAYYGLGKPDQAMSSYEKSIEIDSMYPFGYYGIGYVHYDRGNYEKSDSMLTKAINIWEDYADAYSMRGLVKEETGDFVNAIKDYSKGIKLSPKDCLTYHKRGRTYERMGKYDSAITDYKESIKLDNDSSYYLSNTEGLYFSYKKSDNYEGMCNILKIIEHMNTENDSVALYIEEYCK